MSFPDVNEVAFEMYTEWLYKGYIADYQGLEGDAENEGFDFWSDFVGAYSLGLTIEDPVFFCNAIVEAIIEAFGDGLPYAGHNSAVLIYRNTPGPCRLRELIVDLYLNYYYDRDEAGRKAKWTALPQELLGDLLVCFFKEKKRNNKTWDVDGIKTRMGLGRADNVEDSAN